MDARRFRNHRTQPFENFRWWGCLLLAMFTILQSDPFRPGSPKPQVPPTAALRMQLGNKLNQPLCRIASELRHLSQQPETLC